MHNLLRKSLFGLVLLTGVFVIANCNGTSSQSNDAQGMAFQDTNSTVEVTGVELNKNITSMLIGGTEQLTAMITPITATHKNTTWSSSDDRIATVSEEGLITAVLAGFTTITVKTTGSFSSNYTSTCLVIVTTDPIPVTEINLNKETTTLPVGDTELLIASITPGNATDQNITWSSSNESIATVSEQGLVLAVSVGAATITATTADGPTKDCGVTVETIE